MAEERLFQFVSQGDVSQSLSCVAALSVLGQPSKIREIRCLLVQAGVRKAKDWNIGRALAAAGAFVRERPNGWVVTEEGRDQLKRRGFRNSDSVVSAALDSIDLHLDQISDEALRSYLTEAAACFQHHLYRASVVFSWVGAVRVLQNYIVSGHLTDFNAAGTGRFGDKWNRIKNINSFGRLKESDLLEVCHDVGLVDKTLKNQLVARLDLRNACGHPSSLVVTPHEAAAHLSFLTENVFKRFQT